MPTTTWLVIVAILLIAWYLWAQYGALYLAAHNNPNAVHAGQSIARYATDIQGLFSAYESADSTQGSYMSRLGAFFGALPT